MLITFYVEFFFFLKCIWSTLKPTQDVLSPLLQLALNHLLCPHAAGLG